MDRNEDWDGISPLTPQTHSPSRVIRSPLRSLGLGMSPISDPTRALNFSAATSVDNPSRRSETRPPSDEAEHQHANTSDHQHAHTSDHDSRMSENGSFDTFSATLGQTASAAFQPLYVDGSPFGKYRVPVLQTAKPEVRFGDDVSPPGLNTAYKRPHELAEHHHPRDHRSDGDASRSFLSEGSLQSPVDQSLPGTQSIEFVSTFAHEVETMIQKHNRALGEKNVQLGRLEAHLKELEKRFQYNEGVIAERDAVINDLTSTIQRLQRQLEFTKSAHHRTESRCIDLQGEIDKIRANMEARSEQYESELRDAQRRLSQTADDHLQALHAKELAWEKERRKLQSDLKARLEAESEARLELVERVERDNAQRQALHSTTVADLQKELRTIREEKSSVCKERSEEKERRLILESTVEQYKTQLERSEARVKSLSDEILQERASSESANRTLREQHASEVSSFQSQLATERDTRLKANVEIQILRETISQMEHAKCAIDAAQADDHSSLLMDIRRITQMYEEALTQIKEVKSQHQRQVHSLEEEAQSLKTKLLEATTANSKEVGELSELRLRIQEHTRVEANLRQECRLLQNQVSEYQQKQSSTHHEWENSLRQCQEEVRLLRSKLSHSEREISEEREAMGNQIRSLSAESSLLRKELNRAEQDRWEALNELRQGPEAETSQLKDEVSTLRRRVAALQDANSQMREQVVSMTEDMRSDPISEMALQNASKISHLEQSLSAATNEVGRLVGILQTKEEEIRRYQGRLVGDLASSESDVPTTEAAFWSERCKSVERDCERFKSNNESLREAHNELCVKVNTLMKEREQLLSANNLLQHQLTTTLHRPPTTPHPAPKPIADKQSPAGPLAEPLATKIPSAVEKMSAEHNRRIHTLDRKIASVRDSLKYTHQSDEGRGKSVAKVGSRAVRHYGFA